MHPLHQTIFLAQVILFFVTAIAVAVIAVVAIAHHQCGHIARQASAEREVIRSPNLIDSLFQSVRCVMGAIGVYVVIGVADVNGRTRKSALAATGGQRHVCIVRGFLVAARIVPGILGDPQIDVLAVVKLDIPWAPVSALGPIKFVLIHRGVKGIRATREMRTAAHA